MSSALPPNPNIDHLKKQARDLLKSYQAGDLQASESLRHYLPRFAQKYDREILAAGITLHDAQHVVAHQYGFAHWSALRAAIAERNGAKGRAESGELHQANPRILAVKNLDAKLAHHIEMLGFATVGSYRI